jgi:transcriptional regulator of acetoin/glycerol metabolism
MTTWPSLRDTERAAIIAAIEGADHNCQLAAHRLEISRTVLYRKLKKYGLKRRLGKWQVQLESQQ